MRRFVLTNGQEHALPLFVETVGAAKEADKMVRSEGYPYYHWLQTIRGEGVFRIGDRAYALPANSGILVQPGVPHTYETRGDHWDTAYLTFGGPNAPELLQSLNLLEPVPMHWENDSPMSHLLEGMLDRLEEDADLFGLTASAEAYRFLITLRHYGSPDSPSARVRSSEKLRPLLEWMERSYANADVGLAEMSDVLNMPVSSLNVLFRGTFGVSPYVYLIQLRLRKAKELLINQPATPVKQIAEYVGFRDASHFVATFRRKTGIPPEQFRRLYG
ncbi:AraC family transcriptional regulator [Cohnella fermenti]|uniref:AraC family transcriptional regulator n=1 Tax=Cohnella fermenti TaxID=2565925 RepID=A0A4S4BK70_9BACL|nr:AraC family transcriptional regulator [Cohnella fermenti]THF75108.1 AraC family transcriptional regulator [Cohnella fermenti]